MKKNCSWNMAKINFAAAVFLLLGVTEAEAYTSAFEKNELKVVTHSGFHPSVWMNVEKYRFDFSFDASMVTDYSCESCIQQYQDAYDAGARSYREYQIHSYLTVTAFYDVSGNLVGTYEVDTTPPPAPEPPAPEAEPDTSSFVNNLSGEAVVSPSGAANYSLGIEIPPGVAGMQPGLGVAYDSRAGSGSMGMGWALSGLSAISRCPRTMAVDGLIRGVDYSSNDAYCLDGARLIEVDTNLFRTETGNSVKVEYSGAAFTMYSKDGSVSQYGHTDDSKIEAQGKTAVATWAVNRVTDKFGNYYTYSYIEDNANGDYRIDRIDYTGNDVTSSAPFASVRFSYDDIYSEDYHIGYRAGSKESVTKKLKNIYTYVGEDLVKNYRFIYDYSNNHNTLLTRIYECAATYPDNCKNPIKLTWNQESDQVFGSAISGLTTHVINDLDLASVDIARIKFGDFNGDGRTDIYYVRGWGTSETDTVYLSNGDGTYTAQSGLSTYVDNTHPSVDLDRIQFGDFNGDGRTDIYYLNGWGSSEQDHMYFADADGSFGAGVLTLSLHVGEGEQAAGIDIARLKFGDFDGDGKTDIYYVLGWGTNDADVVYLSNGDGTFRTISTGVNTSVGTWEEAELDLSRYRVVDVNGDGMSDIYMIDGWGNSEYDKLFMATGEGGFSVVASNVDSHVGNSIESAKIDIQRMKLADFNGDGLTDVYRASGSGEAASDTLWISKGDTTFIQYLVSGFQTFVGTDSEASIDLSRIVPGDFDGDGKTDIYIVNGWGNGEQDYIYSYKGEGVFDKQLQGLNTYVHNNTQGASIDISRIKFGDFTGDGALDVYVVNGWGGSEDDFIYPTAMNSKLVVTDFEDGFGNTTSFKYQYLSEAGQSVYTKYNDVSADYSVQDFQGPMRVVSEKETTDGLSGTTLTTYTYEGAKVNLQGRGQLGFAKTTSTNTQTGLVTEVNYFQDHPHTGMVDHETQTLNGNLLSYTKNTEAEFPLGNNRSLPYVGTKRVENYDLDEANTHLSTAETVNVINNPNGDITDVTTTTDETGSGEVYVTYTHSDYGHQASSELHLQSLVTKSSVFKTGPAGTSNKVFQKFNYDTDTGKLLSEKGCVAELDATMLFEDAKSVTTDCTAGTGIHTGIAKTYTYDGFGHINSTSITAPDIETRTVTTQYDSLGQFPVTVTNEMGHQSHSTYDARFGVALSKTDANGLTTTYAYNEFGELTDTYAPGGNVSHTEKAWCTLNCELPAINSSVAAQTAVFTVTTSVAGGVNSAEQYAPDVVAYFDKLGREIRKQTTNFKGDTVLQDTAYDDLGRVVAATQPYFTGDAKNETTTSYDELNRPVETVAPDEGVTTVTYDGFLAATEQTVRNPVTNAITTQTQSESKNVIGQVLQNTDNDGNVLRYEYDAQGNKTKTYLPKVDADGDIVTGENIVIEIQYDVFGRKTAMIDPNMGAWSYSYDSTSKLRSQTDARGLTTVMEYDRAGRMTKRTDDDGTETYWVYNDDLIAGNTPNAMAIGKLESVYMLDGTGFELYRETPAYTVDLGLVDHATVTIQEGTTATPNAVSYVTSSGYDRFHRPETLTYPETVDNATLTIEYTYQNGAVTAVKNADDSVTYWQLDDANAAGQATLFTLGNGMQPVQGYDVAGRLTLLSYGNTTATPYQAGYEYDTLGNLVSRTTLRNNGALSLAEQYYYDSLNRLTSVTIDGIANAQQYSYDVLGNMRTKTGVTGIEYNGTRPHAVSRVNGQDYLYNANGAIEAGGGRTVAWTPFNKPSSISNADATSNFDYGPSRARYRHESIDANDATKNSLTYYVGGSFEKVTVNGITKYKHYIQAGGKSMAQYTIYKDAGNTTQEKTEYLLRDHQGSTVLVTDDAGNVSANLDYDAFGRRRIVGGESAIASIIDEIPRGYTGHEHLDKLGLIHMNGRVYDPELGRFLSADPIIQFSKNIQSYNRYAYVLNNPMSYTDPSGFSLRRLVKAAATVATLGSNVIVAGTVGGVAYSKPVRRMMLKYQWARIALQVGAAVADSMGCGGGCSAAASAYLTDISGGSFGDAARAAAVSFMTQKMFNQVHGEFKNMTMTFTNIAKKVLVHGAVGGLSSYMGGGSFRDGFVGAAVSQAAFAGMESMGFEFYKDPTGWEYVYNGVAASVVGGLASKAAGGDFEAGAKAALYGRLFNDMAPRMRQHRNKPPRERVTSLSISFGIPLPVTVDGEPISIDVSFTIGVAEDADGGHFFIDPDFNAVAGAGALFGSSELHVFNGSLTEYGDAMSVKMFLRFGGGLLLNGKTEEPQGVIFGFGFGAGRWAGKFRNKGIEASDPID